MGEVRAASIFTSSRSMKTNMAAALSEAECRRKIPRISLHNSIETNKPKEVREINPQTKAAINRDCAEMFLLRHREIQIHYPGCQC